MQVEYRMTRKITTINSRMRKLNLDGTFPFEADDDVVVTLERVSDGRVWTGERKVILSGSSRAVRVPASAGLEEGDLVHATIRRKGDDDPRGKDQEGHQGVPQLQGHILGHSPRGGVRQVGGPGPHSLLQGHVRRPGGQDVRGQAERDTEGPPEGDRGVRGRLRDSPQREGRRGGPEDGGRQAQAQEDD